MKQPVRRWLRRLAIVGCLVAGSVATAYASSGDSTAFDWHEAAKLAFCAVSIFAATTGVGAGLAMIACFVAMSDPAD
jgi:hypothetical protein